MRYFLSIIAIFSIVQLNAQIFPTFGDSRTGSTGFQFLKIAPDARFSAMGGSAVASVNDLSSLYWNPSGITQLDTQKLHFGVHYTQYFSDISMQYASFATEIGDGTFIGVNVGYLHSGQMDVTTEFNPFGNGQTFGTSDLSLGLSLGRTLTDNFSFGVTLKYLREQVADITTNNGVLDFGFQYNIGFANTRFAVVISDFGFPVSPKGDIERYTLNGNINANEFQSVAVPTVFRLGVASDILAKEEHLLTVTGQLNHPTDNNETYALGTEYSWKKLIYFRAGAQFATDSGILPSAGAGIQLKRNFGKLNIDYGVSSTKNLGLLHRMSLNIGIL